MEDQARTELQNALRRILRPLVRILLRQGFSIGELTELIKRAYMEVAWDEFTPEGTRPSDSRVAIMTGLTRKEVKRLRETRGEDPMSSLAQMNRATRVLSGWHRDPDFCGQDGKPAALNLTDAEQGFAALVKRYSGDMPPRAMLDELARVGAVDIHEQGSDTLISARSRSFIPEGGDAAHLKLFGMSVSDLTTNWDFNLQPAHKDERWLQGHVFTQKLARKAVPLLRNLASERGQSFMENLDDWLLSHETEQSEDQVEMGVGIYLFRREREDSES